MKKNIIIAVILLVLFSISIDIVAQPKKGKKKHGKKQDTTATVAPPVDNTPPPTVVAPPPSDDDHDTSLNWIGASGLTADTNGRNNDMNDFVLDSTRPTDGFYHQTTLRGAKPFPLIKPNKNNLKVYKRIWREIDLTDSVNKIFCSPGETLIQLILTAMQNKKIIAYRDDEFIKPISYEKAMLLFRDSVIIENRDANGDLVGTTMALNDFNPDSVTKFEIKEDIVFDKIRGRMINEIVSLAPVIYKGSARIAIKPFFLSFNQCRNLFAAREVIDLTRDIQNMSYDDLFIQRNFKSRIIKEANPGNTKIRDKFPDEASQKKESERIEREIRNYKKKLWKY